MLDPELTKAFAALGVGGAIAGFMFLFYRKDLLAVVEAQKDAIAILMQVVKENTIAITANTKTIEALHRRMDRDYPEPRRHE